MTIFFLVTVNLLSISHKLFNPPSSPNVLLIVADALRADHLGCYGYDRPTSPQIDNFAAESLVFERALSNSPWTKPSMGTIFTSLYPHQHQAFHWSDNLKNECLTLAEVFRNRNYSTFAKQTNPSITKKYNFNQGFQHYEEMVLEKGERVTNKFIEWLRKNKNKPFFAYLHYMDTHFPYNAPREFSRIFGIKEDSLFNPGEFKTVDIRLLTEMGLSAEEKNHLISLYDGAIKYFDYNFKVIMDNLKELKITDKTIIVFTADHGEEFWDHGGFAHGHTLYRELLHVPLIIRYPPLFQAERIKFNVPLLDLFPTILSMAGIKDIFDSKGKDLIAIIRNKSSADHEIYCEGLLDGVEKKAIIKDEWKLIENTGQKNKDSFLLLGELTRYKYPEYESGFELYNIKHDFSETYNQINNFPQIAGELKAYLRLFKMPPLNYRKQKIDNYQKKLEDLKSLGYIK
ncbi:MAG: sulfatase [Candidatus Aminicenantales bacterium]